MVSVELYSPGRVLRNDLRCTDRLWTAKAPIPTRLAAGDDALILMPRPASAPAQAYRGAKMGIGVNGSGQSVHELAVYGAALKGKIVLDARRRYYRRGRVRQDRPHLAKGSAPSIQ